MELMSDVLDIRPILVFMYDNKGIDFMQYKDATLRRRLNRRMTACSCNDIDSYLLYIRTHAEEIDRLLADLTIKYTEFFRDSLVYDAIRDDVLPSIISAKPKTSDEKITIWSAGCATGEEPYSLAALMKHAIDSGRCSASVSIVGTDVDPAALQLANKAAYVKDFMPRPLNDEMSAYFEDDGKWLRPLPELRELVSFHHHNLIGPLALEQMQHISKGSFDLVVCRNVLIYLLRDTQSTVIRLCCDLLRPGGFLILGTKENLPRCFEVDGTLVNKGLGIYRKPLQTQKGSMNAQ